VAQFLRRSDDGTSRVAATANAISWNEAGMNADRQNTYLAHHEGR
jgi:hypothetical protein